MNRTGALPPTLPVSELEVRVIGGGERVFGIYDVADVSGQLPPDPHTAATRLTQAVAGHLGALRPQADAQGRATGAPGAAVTTFAHEPAPVAGMVRLGHLVTVSGLLAQLLDLPRASQECVIWEQLPAQAVPAWLGTPPPEAEPPSPQRLLLLKRAVREGSSLPDTPAGCALAELLASGRYLSARLAHQYPDLLRSILDDLDPPTEPGPAPAAGTAPPQSAHSRRGHP